MMCGFQGDQTAKVLFVDWWGQAVSKLLLHLHNHPMVAAGTAPLCVCHPMKQAACAMLLWLQRYGLLLLLLPLQK
jgi:hypothetical protein